MSRAVAGVVVAVGAIAAAIVLQFVGAVLSPLAKWSGQAGADGATVDALHVAPDGALLLPVIIIGLLCVPIVVFFQHQP